ncbi:hypothetical protein [Nocardiopsis salina]|uniref:hypothetical protein n=1 Tax=Nocardiopsis salina TaxID=245836 RepID=UPI00034C9190|nr:hypothetical protein [Nocardiopsis salina]
MSAPSHGLAADILAVLDQHGHHCPDDQARGAAIILLGDVLDAYQGRINSARMVRESHQHGAEGAE